MRATGVSKLCCPVCAFLLGTVEPSFIFTSAHNTIKACSLSPHFSLEVVQSAIAQFGAQLREELGELMKRTKILQSCDESINSNGFSTDSFGSDIDLQTGLGHSEESSSDLPFSEASKLRC